MLTLLAHEAATNGWDALTVLGVIGMGLGTLAWFVWISGR